MPGQTPDSFVEWVTREMAKNGWSERELARESGLSHTPIVRALNGDQPTYDTCMALARAFGVPPEKLLRLAGLLPTRSDKDETWDDIRAYYDEGDGDDRRLMKRIMREIIQEKRQRESQLQAQERETVSAGVESGR